MFQRAYKNHPFRTTGALGLMIGPILIIVFSFLMPGGGLDAENPQDVGAVTAALGGDATMAQIAMIATALGGALYVLGIAGLARTANAGVASAWLGFGIIAAAASFIILTTGAGIGLGQAAASETAVGGGATAAAAGAVAAALHAARLGTLQIGAMVTALSLIVIGWGAYKGAATPTWWGLVYAALGLAMLILPWIMPVREESGQMIFGIMMFIWAILTIPAGYYLGKSAADNPPMAAAATAPAGASTP
jgi:hypothetical protein